MNDIDVSKCEYYNDYHKTCSNFSRCSDDEPYCDPKNFKCSYYIRNIDKQLQQLKAENEELQEMNRNLSEKFANVCGGCFEQKLREKYEQCFDEIEEIIKGFSCCEWFGNCECCELSDDKNPCLNEILQLIKQAKEGEE